MRVMSPCAAPDTGPRALMQERAAGRHAPRTAAAAGAHHVQDREPPVGRADEVARVRICRARSMSVTSLDKSTPQESWPSAERRDKHAAHRAACTKRVALSCTWFWGMLWRACMEEARLQQLLQVADDAQVNLRHAPRPGDQQAPGLALTQTDAAPPLRAAARCSTAPGDWQAAGRRTWGGPAPGSPRRSRGSGSASRPRSTRWSARAAWCTARTCPAPPPARGARAGHRPAASTEKAFRARPPVRILLGALARARTLCGRPPGMRGARSGLRSLRVRRPLSPCWLRSGLAASLSARTRLRQVVADRRGEQRGVVALVDVVQLLEEAGGPLVDQRDDVRLDLRVAPQKDAEFPVDGGALCGKERKSM